MNVLRTKETVTRAWERLQCSREWEGDGPLHERVAFRRLAESAHRLGWNGRIVRWWTEERQSQGLDLRLGSPPYTRALLIALRLPLLGETKIPTEAVRWIYRLMSGLGDRRLEAAGRLRPSRLRPIRLDIRAERGLDLGDRPGRPEVLGDTPVVTGALRRSEGASGGGDESMAFTLVAQGLQAALLEMASSSRDVESAGRELHGYTSFAFAGEDGADRAAIALLTAAAWWREAQPDDAFAVLGRMQGRFPQSLAKILGSPVEKELPILSKRELALHTVEFALQGIEQFTAIFGRDAEGESESYGWARELEAATRWESEWLRATGLPVGDAGAKSASPAPHVDADGEVLRGARRRGFDLEPEAVYVTADAAAAGLRPFPTSDRLWWSARRVALFDGERSLAEAVYRLALQTGNGWEEVWEKALEWVRRGWLVPAVGESERYANRMVSRREWTRDPATRPGRTLLYFSYGSCMCLPSFRETVPVYDFLGAARLPGFRLGFTFESAFRSGGVADVVADETEEVWGVLYRIPKTYLSQLDEREGVNIGHYERMWIGVERFGAIMSPVLTYTVVKKAGREIPPSPEYAGLIVDGAQGVLPPRYVRRLLQGLDEMGVDPSLP